MTLVLNEIHFEDGFQNSFMIAAADSRITDDNGRVETQQKVFPLPKFHGAISFFGLAEVWEKGGRKDMSTWLERFIANSADMSSLGSFSKSLQGALHEVIPLGTLRLTHSGFHICGYTKDGWPDFWYLANIGGMPKPFVYDNFSDRYGEPSSHFLGRDASKCGWDGQHPQSVRGGGQLYRNGDFKQHAVAWEAMDLPLVRLREQVVMRIPRSPQEYARYFRAKYEFLSALSEDLYLADGKPSASLIGRPIGVFLMTPEGVTLA